MKLTKSWPAFNNTSRRTVHIIRTCQRRSSTPAIYSLLSAPSTDEGSTGYQPEIPTGNRSAATTIEDSADGRRRSRCISILYGIRAGGVRLPAKERAGRRLPGAVVSDPYNSPTGSSRHTTD
ncbi:hypothetical protein B0T17DRAFT_312016 [Bombardia bombarda]|uniref:Uncharacterized protein n=1 Tax=Bombardia bombarda TaxID=252184 RepID=A0AA40BXX5_9PEZI|nr:hypothetical protein B0T17DRAFT_312016 [Bombardia bombarda]